MKKIVTVILTIFFLQGIVVSQEIKFLQEITFSDEIIFYISPNGNDTWAGTSEMPFCTLQKARDAIRGMKSRGKVNRPVIVFLRGGLYELPETFILKPEDSGSETCPVTYMAYPGEQPVISGSKQIVSQWEIYKDKIMVCPLPAQIARKINFKQLFVDGERQVRARTPDESYYNTDGKSENLKNTQIKFREGDNKSWINVKNAELVLLNMSVGSRLFISDINPLSRLISLTGPYEDLPAPQNSPYSKFSGSFYLENALEFLDKPKEWFLDFAGGKLFYWPVLPADRSIIRVPVLKQLMKLEGNLKEKNYVQYVNFSSLIFSDSDWSVPKEGHPGNESMGDIVLPSAISFDGAANCTFKNNKIRNTGAYAIEITGFANQITDNEITNTGGGGIITRSFEKPQNTISYNSIYYCGQVFPGSVGIYIEDGGGIISHNLIHDIPHSGISTKVSASPEGARRNQEQALIIEFNEIYKVMQKLNGGAGIFVQDSNIIIRNNLVYDVVARAGGAPGWGISLETRTRNTLVENNLIRGTIVGLNIESSNRNNLIINNIFVASEDAMVSINNDTDQQILDVRLTGNIFYFGNTDAYIYHISGDKFMPAESDNNVFWNPYRCLLLSPSIFGVRDVDYIADWRKKGFDKHSLVADPKFVQEQNKNYELKNGSPAFKAGFKPFNISNVGLRGRGKP